MDCSENITFSSEFPFLHVAINDDSLSQKKIHIQLFLIKERCHMYLLKPIEELKVLPAIQILDIFNYVVFSAFLMIIIIA